MQSVSTLTCETLRLLPSHKHARLESAPLTSRWRRRQPTQTTVSLCVSVACGRHSPRSATRLIALLLEIEGTLGVLCRRKHPFADACLVSFTGTASTSRNRQLRQSLLAPVSTRFRRPDSHRPPMATRLALFAARPVGLERTTRGIRARPETTRPTHKWLTLPLFALAVPLTDTPYATLEKAITTTRATTQSRRPLVISRSCPRAEHLTLETTTTLAFVLAS